MKSVKLEIKKNCEYSLINYHPWVYTDAFKSIPSNIESGNIATLITRKGVVPGLGYIDRSSNIFVRMIAATPGESFRAALFRLIDQAAQIRTDYFYDNSQTNAYRIVNGEGDFLPGLIIDKYAQAVCVQIYSEGLKPWLKDISNGIKKALPETKWIYLRDGINLKKFNIASMLHGKNMPDKIIFKEDALNYSVDLINGQKTGFFLDQRSNRKMIRKISKNKKVLNICGYTGAFSVAAAAGGATETLTIDCAAPALEEAKNNFKLNGLETKTNKLVCADMYEYLSNCTEKFDLIVLDPPSMAKSKKDTAKAISCYKKLNRLAMKKLVSGGYLFTASCSSRISRDDFFQIVHQSAQKTNKNFRIIHESFHDIDHPVAIFHSEGKYLKGVLLKACQT